MIRKFAAEIFQNAKKAAVLCQILRMVTTELAINSIPLMAIRVTISFRYCIAFEVLLLFLVFLPAGCHGNLPVLNLLNQWPKISIFAPAGKTMRWMEK